MPLLQSLHGDVLPLASKGSNGAGWPQATNTRCTNMRKNIMSSRFTAPNRRHKKTTFRWLLVRAVLMVPKAGLEPARISTVDFESTASTDFATSALQVVCGKRVHYTFQRSACNTYPLFNELSAEKIVIVAVFPLPSILSAKDACALSPARPPLLHVRWPSRPPQVVITAAHSDRHHAEAPSTLRKIDKQPINRN